MFIPAERALTVYIDRQEIVPLMTLGQHPSVYKQTEAVHACALFKLDERVRRPLVYTTGRLTSEMMMKAAQMAIPIVMSRSGMTQMGWSLAQ